MQEMHMSSEKGNFSKNLMSLQLQIQTLFEDAGGEGAVEFLDSLSKLSATEQKVALQFFGRIVERIAKGDMRYFTDSELALKELEDSLFLDILGAMQEASKPSKSRKLAVVDGGKTARVSAPKATLDLAKAREAKRANVKPVLN